MSNVQFRLNKEVTKELAHWSIRKQRFSVELISIKLWTSTSIYLSKLTCILPHVTGRYFVLQDQIQPLSSIPSTPVTPAVTELTDIVLLTPVATLHQYLLLKNDEYVTLVLDVCLHEGQPDYTLMSTVISTEGVLTQYICFSTPCLPDGTNVLCSADSPLPISTCTVSLATNPKQVFVTLHSLALSTKIKFGALFEKVK